MPPKDHARKKQEIAAKVLEIKEKQQKWMNEKRELDGGNKTTSKHNRLLSKSPATSHSTNFLQKSMSPDHHSMSVQPSSDLSTSSYHPGNYRTPEHSAEDYNLVADRIISRVKHEVGVNSDVQKGDGLSHSNGQVDLAPLSSHLCYKCRNLMVPPNHSPMMLIPCGHNLCEACCRDIVCCYSCKSEVSGVTSNVTLQQIIAAKNSTSKSKSLGRRKANHRDADEQEAQTLLLRREAMEEEKSNIEETIATLNSKIKEEVVQISSVEKREAAIIGEISHLQSKLVKLQEHKQEFKEKITSHKSHIASEVKKIELIKDTIEYLSSRLTILENKT